MLNLVESQQVLCENTQALLKLAQAIINCNQTERVVNEIRIGDHVATLFDSEGIVYDIEEVPLMPWAQKAIVKMTKVNCDFYVKGAKEEFFLRNLKRIQ